METAVLLEGTPADTVLDEAWQTAEAYWAHEGSELWQPAAAEAAEEVLAPDVLTPLRSEIDRDPVFQTISSGRPNRVTDVTPVRIWVETESSLAKGRPPHLMPAWMFQLAFDHLRTHGSLSNSYLVFSDGLNVKRSWAVCAILARLPRVVVTNRRPVELANQRLKAALRRHHHPSDMEFRPGAEPWLRAEPATEEATRACRHKRSVLPRPHLECIGLRVSVRGGPRRTRGPSSVSFPT